MNKHTPGPWVDIEQIQAEISDWQSGHLDADGRYIGRDLRRYGFPWSANAYIPVDSRYSAMLEYRTALKVCAMMGGKP